MSKSGITVLVPSYDSHDYVLHLTQLLTSITMQKVSFDVNILISFHSDSNAKFSLVQELTRRFDLDIHLFSYRRNLGNWQSNVNFLLDRVNKSMITKFMFQDDIFVRPDTLEIVFDNLRTQNSWLALGCTHFTETFLEFSELPLQNGLFVNAKFQNDLMPKWDDRMPRELINFIGGPTVVAISGAHKARFDRRFHFAGDVEFYYALKRELGSPIIIPSVHVGIRKHADSFTSMLESGSQGRMANSRVLSAYKGRMPDGRRVQTRKDVHVREVFLMNKKYGFATNSHKYLIMSLIKRVSSRVRTMLKSI